MIILPNECIFEIFVKLNKNDLFSCLLVNRHWCKNVVPILWKRQVFLGNKKFIRILLLLLNFEEQALLIPFKLKLPNGPKPLFEYTSYITYINFSSDEGISDWLHYEGYESPSLTYFISNVKVYMIHAIKYSLTMMLLRTTSKLQGVWINNIIDDKIMNSLAKTLKNVNLSYLNFWKCELNSVRCKVLAEALYTNSSLIDLYFGCSQLDSEGEKSLVNIICKNTTLKSLKFYNNQLGTEEGKAIAEAIGENITLTSLEFDTQISIKAVKALAKSLIKNSKLTHLDLDNNNLGFEAGKAFAEVLCKNTTLVHLNLYGNKLGFVGINVLANALGENVTLTALNLGYNDVCIESIKSLARALYKNTVLVSLSLLINHINSDGGKILAEVLSVNTTLTSLNLSYNSINDEILSKIKILLERNERSFHLGNNSIINNVL